MDEYLKKLYPPANRFVVEFVGFHLLTTGEWASRPQKRFRLADSAKQALADVMLELNNPRFWPAGFHEPKEIKVRHCPDEPAIVGYCRFGDENDIRTTK
jgi:hypothetical protein